MNLNLERQIAAVTELTADQYDIYARFSSALREMYPTSKGFHDCVAAVGVLAATLRMAQEDAKADGFGCNTEEHY